MTRRTVDELLKAARARLDRLEPAAAYDAVRAGAHLIDIRSERQMARDGMFPDALIIPRNVLEWRLDPDCAYRHPQAPEPGELTIVACNEGYQSSLVAATLRDMGFTRATDLAGGFQGWRAAGLPVLPFDADRLAAAADLEAHITGTGESAADIQATPPTG